MDNTGAASSKQALIAYFGSFLSSIPWMLLSVGFCIGTFIGSIITYTSGPAILPGLIGSAVVPALVVGREIMNRLRLGKFLKENGYVVEYAACGKAYAMRKLRQMALNSDANSQTFLLLEGHGRPDGHSAMEGIARATLLREVCKIRGNKNVLINACRAGGFVDFARGMKASQTEHLFLATSSASKELTRFNRFVPLFEEYARKSGGKALEGFPDFVQDERRRAYWLSWARALRKPVLCLSPRIFVGKRAALAI